MASTPTEYVMRAVRVQAEYIVSDGRHRPSGSDIRQAWRRYVKISGDDCHYHRWCDTWQIPDRLWDAVEVELEEEPDRPDLVDILGGRTK